MSETTDDTAEDAIGFEPKAWLGVTFLTWSVVLSALFHTSFLIPAFLADFRPGSAEVDIEWLKSFDSLEGIGHGSSGRFAEIDAASFHTRNDAPKAEEPEPPAEEPPPPQPDPEPEKKPEPETKPKLSKPKPQPKQPQKPLEKPPEKAEPKKPTTPREVYTEGDLPGLDRAGPNGLPAMENYGPGNAILTALVRLDRIRGSEYEKSVRDLLEAVPDYRILLQGTEVDPLRDLDSMFMASADPVYIEETFLAVRHRLGRGELQTRLDKRFDQPIPWQKQRGYPTRDLVPNDSRYVDPRKILLAGGDLALVIRPEWVSQLTTALPPDSELVRGVDLAALDRAPSMLDGLAHIERAAEASDAIVLMSAMGMRLVIPGVGRLAFEGAKLQIAGIENPRFTADVAFRTPAEATRFAGDCPKLKKKIIDEVPGLARSLTRMVVERLTCEASGHYVAVEGKYTAAEAQRVLNIAGLFVPRPKELAYLPPGPPRPPKPKREDDGAADGGPTLLGSPKPIESVDGSPDSPEPVESVDGRPGGVR